MLFFVGAFLLAQAFGDLSELKQGLLPSVGVAPLPSFDSVLWILGAAGLMTLALAIVFAVLKRSWRARRYLAMSFREIDGLTGEAFESFAAEIFRARGYRVIDTPLSGDFGCDLLLGRGGEKICVQAKRYRKKVGLRAVQEVVASLPVYGASAGAVVTNSFFTKPAERLAAANGVELIDREDLMRLLLKAKGKYRS